MKQKDEPALSKNDPATKPESHKEIVKGGVSAFTTRLVGMGLNTVFGIILGRGFGTEGTGIYSLAQSLVNFCGSIGKLGSDTLMTRFAAQYAAQGKWGWIKDLFNKSMLVSIPLGMVLSVAVYFLAPWLAATVFSQPTMEAYFRIAAFAILPLTIFAISNGGLRGLKRIWEYTFLQNVSYYLFGILILLAFMFFTRDKSAPIYTYVIFVTLSCGVSLFWWFRYSKYNKTKVEGGLLFNEKFWIGMSLFIGALATLVRGYTDTFFISKFSTLDQVGIYRNAFRIATFTKITLTALLVPSAPIFSELFSQGKMKELAHSAQYITKLIFWTSIPLLIVTLIFPKLIMSIFGEGFKSGSVALMILAVGQFINAATGPVSNLLNMTGKQNLNRNLQVLATLLAIGLDWWLVPLYGATGAAAVNTFGILLMNMIPFFLIKKYYGFYTFNFKDIMNVKFKEIIPEVKSYLKKSRNPQKETKKQTESDVIDPTLGE